MACAMIDWSFFLEFYDKENFFVRQKLSGGYVSESLGSKLSSIVNGRNSRISCLSETKSDFDAIYYIYKYKALIYGLDATIVITMSLLGYMLS